MAEPRENRLASRRWLLLRHVDAHDTKQEDFCQTPDATDSRSALCFRHGQNKRCSALGRKNWLFGGSDRGAHWLAIHQTLLGSCALAGITDPWTYLRDVLTKLARGWPQSRLGELVPTAWLAAQATAG